MMDTPSSRLDRCAGLLRRLVSVDTQNPPGNEQAMAELLLRLMDPPKENYALIPCGPGRCSLLVTLPGRRRDKTVVLAGHMDTVPAGDPARWSDPPLAGVRHDSKMSGRGAVDMKGGLCAMIMLYLGYHTSGSPPPCTLRFLFTADEESDGAGIRAACESGLLDDSSFLLVCEPTANRAGLCEMGTLWYRFSVHGRSCHASMCHNGINALECGMALTRRILARFDSLPPHPLLGKACAAVTRAKGGVKINIVPDFAEFEMDLRTVPIHGGTLIETENFVFRAIQRLTAEVPGLSLKAECLTRRPELEASLSHPGVQCLMRAMETLDMDPAPAGVRFFTDASIAVPMLHVPFAICGPGDPQQCHTANETADLPQIPQTADLYERFLDRYSQA